MSLGDMGLFSLVAHNRTIHKHGSVAKVAFKASSKRCSPAPACWPLQASTDQIKAELLTVVHGNTGTQASSPVAASAWRACPWGRRPATLSQVRPCSPRHVGLEKLYPKNTCCAEHVCHANAPPHPTCNLLHLSKSLSGYYLLPAHK